MEPAYFSQRLCAFIIDRLILMFFVLVVLPHAIMFDLFIVWIYCAGFESSPLQATPGKMLLRLKVQDEKGERISFLRSTARQLASLLSSMIFCIGYFMMFFTKGRKTLHDILTKTMVVQEEKKEEAEKKAS